MSEPTLLPCPFCGVTARVEQTGNGDLFYVACINCPASMGNVHRAWRTVTSAAEWWNKRFTKPPEVLPEKKAGE